MQIFTARAAGQLNLCLPRLAGREAGSEGGERDQDVAGLVSAHAKQLTQLGQLHAQAHAEPVESQLQLKAWRADWH